MGKVKKVIHSNEKSSYWILIGIGFLFFTISIPILFALPEEINTGNYGILLALLFPLTGLGMMYAGWKMRKKFFFFGPTPLTPSPLIGQVGGQIGGHIDIEKPWEERNLDIILSCIHTYSTGSKDNRTTHTDILWQAHDKPFDRANGNNSTLEFVFDVPADKPIPGSHKGRGSISWQVTIRGTIANEEFNRSWKLPVEAGTKESSIIIPLSQKKSVHKTKLKQAESSVEQQIKTEKTDLGLDILSDQGRHKSMSLIMIAFGFIFTAAGCFLFYMAFHEGDVPWIMPPIFFLIGSLILSFGIFLLGRKLECKIIDDQVHTRRSFFGKVIYTRQGKLTSPDQLILKSTMSSTDNGIKTEYMAIYAKVNINGPNGLVAKEIKLVEGIKGRPAGEAMKRKLIEHLQEELIEDLNQELGI